MSSSRTTPNPIAPSYAPAQAFAVFYLAFSETLLPFPVVSDSHPVSLGNVVSVGDQWGLFLGVRAGAFAAFVFAAPSKTCEIVVTSMLARAYKTALAR